MKMMNVKNSRRLCLLLALLLLLSLLGSCAKSDDNTDTSDVTTEAPPSADFVFIENGVCLTDIIRPEDAADGEVSYEAAKEIHRLLKRYSGDANIRTDFVRKDQTHDASAREILVGITNYEETARMQSLVPFGGWGIHVDGNKLVLYSIDDAGLRKAENALIELLIRYAHTDENGVYNVTVPGEELEIIGTALRKSGQTPVVDGATPVCFYSAGNSCDELIYDNGSPEIITAYAEKLQAEGYTLFAENDLDGNLFYTLYNDQLTVNVGYYSNNDQIRVLSETNTPQTLFGAEADNQYTAVTTSQLTMLGVGYTKDDGSRPNNGASVLIRLSDGRFIVIDGGHAREPDMRNLITQMKEQSKDYAKNGQITVAAWIITHPHGDHFGALLYCTDLLPANKVTVETIMCNLMSEEELQKYNTANNRNDNQNLDRIRSVAAQLKADIIVPHVGNTYFLADMKMETLYTIESYGPKVINDLNGESMIQKMTFTDPKTGTETVFLSIGDSTGYSLRTAANTFGEYMKADICQIAHHGASSWGDDSGTKLGYSFILPRLVLWTSTANGYKNDPMNDYVMNRRTNPALERVLDAGDDGKATIVPLPFAAIDVKTVYMKQ